MGYYINPPDKTKEEWLAEHGTQVDDPTWPPPDGHLIVCLVQNPKFTAAGIVCNQQDFEEFSAPDPTREEINASRQKFEALGAVFISTDTGDQRPRTWFYVPTEKILEVEPRVSNVLEAMRTTN